MSVTVPFIGFIATDTLRPPSIPFFWSSKRPFIVATLPESQGAKNFPDFHEANRESNLVPYNSITAGKRNYKRKRGHEGGEKDVGEGKKEEKES